MVVLPFGPGGAEYEKVVVLPSGSVCDVARPDVSYTFFVTPPRGSVIVRSWCVGE